MIPLSGIIRLARLCGAVIWLGSMLPLAGAEQGLPQLNAKERAPNISLQNEVRLAVDKGWRWLEKNQDAKGFWSTPDHPAITALVLSSYQLQARHSHQPEPRPPSVEKGYDYLLSCAQADGGIYRKDLPSYNTSISLAALVLAGKHEYDPAILKARRFIIGLQADMPGSPLNGGIGYGKADKTPDLSNTMDALEALSLSRSYLKDRGLAAEGDLNWSAAIQFVQSCQNLPSHNSQKWASEDPQNQGGFIYAPGASKAGETNLGNGRVALRSYGSMSYAGLLSYIYADLKPGDPRVTAVMDWLRANYTLDENPALGSQGLFYYYHTMAKALTLYGADSLLTGKGQTVNWREQLVLKLINLQHADGSWANENGRWFEKDPALVTAYSLISLGLVEPKL